MIEIASKLKLKEPADQARVEILPLLMKVIMLRIGLGLGLGLRVKVT
jgi:hypothetical protein